VEPLGDGTHHRRVLIDKIVREAARLTSADTTTPQPEAVVSKQAADSDDQTSSGERGPPANSLSNERSEHGRNVT
jgi:hypothetical protein